MSATLDAGPVAELLGGAPVIRAEGRSYPVAVRHARHLPRDPIGACCTAILEALAETPGDILAFLPGVAEIAKVSAWLASRLDPTIAVLPLHGSLTMDQQQRALVPQRGRPTAGGAGDGHRRDERHHRGGQHGGRLGVARKPRFDPGSGLSPSGHRGHPHGLGRPAGGACRAHRPRGLHASVDA